MNDVDPVLDAQIEKNHGIRYGSGIFTLNEGKTKNKIQENLAKNNIGNVSIVGLERVFPNRVKVHYIKTTDYFHIYSDGQVYTVSNKGVITSVKENLNPDAKTVEVKAAGSLPADLSVGDSFDTDDQLDRARLSAVTYTFDRLKAPYTGRDSFFEFVDISKNYIYVKTTRSVYIEIFAPGALTPEDYAEQFRLGLTMYENYLNADPQNPYRIDMAPNGTIIVTRPADGGKPYAAYTNDYRYAERVG
jgi:hypothetical protein